MNKFYNNEDDFLRDKLVEHEFDVLPQAWEQMSALLDSQPVVAKRSAGYYWWGLSIAALIIGAASSVYYYNGKKTPTTPPTAVATTPVPMALQTKATVSKSKSTLKNQPKPSTLSSESSATTPSENNFAAAKSNYNNPVVNLSIANTTTTSSSTTNNSKNSEPTVAANSTPANEVAPTAQAPAVTGASEGNGNIERKISINTTPITTPKILSEGQQPRVMKRRTEIIYQYSTTPLRALQEKRAQELGTFGIQEEVDFKKSPIQFGVVVGASAQMPAISPSKVAFRPLLGAQVSAKLAKHHHIQLGAQYKNLAVDAAPTIVNNTYTGDQSQHQHSSHQINGLHLVEFPVVYKLQPHPKYNLQAGVKPTLLVGMDSDARQHVNMKEANTGLSSWDLGVLLGAEYTLNEHWSIGIQYTMGLMNMAQQSQVLHTEYQENNSLSSDPLPAQAISKEQELLVPVGGDQGASHYLRVPDQIRNSDLQLLLKYNF